MGRWPWKSESAKECVTTHLPNELALKMDGAEANYLYSTTRASAKPWTWILSGNTSKAGYGCGSPEESSLFFLTSALTLESD
ncbi:hypothetical protein HJC23_005183 [Cyclotella cryptica]|uniref:Uncharacterized protein n=1 Tax=Cyclotella cryptica TaxID=29204 RepID=A0ABD3QF71_9STRA